MHRACHRLTLVCLCAAAILLGVAPALADEKPDALAQCEAMLDSQRSERPVQQLSISGEPDGAVVLHLEHAPELQKGRDDVYVERQRYLDAEGELVREIVEVQSCGAEGLRIDGFDIAGRGQISFEPARTWVPLPMEVGATWTWQGAMRFVDADGYEMRMESTLEGKVAEKGTVRVPGGEFEAYRLEVMTVERVPEHDVELRSDYESWVVVEPHYLLIKRRFESGEHSIELEALTPSPSP